MQIGKYVNDLHSSLYSFKHIQRFACKWVNHRSLLLLDLSPARKDVIRKSRMVTDSIISFVRVRVKERILKETLRPKMRDKDSTVMPAGNKISEIKALNYYLDSQ